MLNTLECFDLCEMGHNTSECLLRIEAGGEGWPVFGSVCDMRIPRSRYVATLAEAMKYATIDKVSHDRSTIL